MICQENPVDPTITFYINYNPLRKNPFKPVAKRGADGCKDWATAANRAERLNQLFNQKVLGEAVPA
jgi:hypothetical protein